METKTLTHSAAELSEAVQKTLENQVIAENVIVFLADFSDSTTYTLTEGQRNGYYVRYFKSV